VYNDAANNIDSSFRRKCACRFNEKIHKDSSLPLQSEGRRAANHYRGIHAMNQQDRRAFVKSTVTGVATAAALTSSLARAKAAGANERVNVGLIGCGGRGIQVARTIGSQKDAVVRYVCDPDRARAANAKDKTGADHAVADLREILDDKAIDAVVIAACDHWHAPAAILACEAGKHVYVEKPCSHSVREGRMMIQAARRNGRVMQHGTQTRSKETAKAAIKMLRDGVIGDVLIAKHINSQKRSNIGHRKPSKAPDHIDYDLWVGPAEWRPYQSNYVHYHWHWFYNFGTGDIGNDGVHGIDVARWGLGVETHPTFVAGYGSKLYFDDDQEFPDSYQMTFEYPADGKVGNKRVLLYEQRIWSPYREDGDGTSTTFYGTNGMMKSTKSGWKLFGPRNEPREIAELPEDRQDAHQRNFLDAIRADESLNAEIEVGHLSSTLCHLGNIVSRTGRAVRFDSSSEQIVGDEQANALTRRKYRKDHWAVPAEA
jgi:predicted dehydrogenase